MEVDADVQTGRWARSRWNPLSSPRRGIGWLLACYWTLMFVCSHVTLSEGSPALEIQDKVLHFAAFAGLALLAMTYQHVRKGGTGWLDLAAVWGILAAYGAFDEITQIPVGRTGDPLDWLADAAGAAAGLLAFVVLRAALGWLSAIRPGQARQIPGEA